MEFLLVRVARTTANRVGSLRVVSIIHVAKSVAEVSQRVVRRAIQVSALWKKRLGDWVVNPYIGCQHGCRHCYCPAMPGVKFFNGGRPQEEWGHYLMVKPGIVEATERELRRLTPEKARRTEWGRGIILLSFQPAERHYGITRKIVRLLLEAGHRVRIQTRSDLVERDFDILAQHRDRMLLGTSLPYLDDALAKRLEPGAPAPSRRLRMLKHAGAVGIPIYVAIAPVMPWHGREVLEEIADRVLPLNPVEVFSEVLNPRGSNLQMMQRALGSDAHLLDGYAHEWPRFTHAILTEFKRIFGSVAIPWPDKGAVRRLPKNEADALVEWLPREYR